MKKEAQKEIKNHLFVITNHYNTNGYSSYFETLSLYRRRDKLLKKHKIIHNDWIILCRENLYLGDDNVIEWKTERFIKDEKIHRPKMYRCPGCGSPYNGIACTECGRQGDGSHPPGCYIDFGHGDCVVT